MPDDQNPTNPQDESTISTTLGTNSPVSYNATSGAGLPVSDDTTSQNTTSVSDQGSTPNPISPQNTNDSADSLMTSPPVSPDNINQDSPDTVVTSPHAPKKYGGNKVIATIFGVLILVGGVTAGVILVQRQQLLEQEAASGSVCNQSPDCVLVDDAPNSGSRTVERSITYVDITDQVYHRYNPGNNDDGCRRVNISGNTVNWERYGSGNECKEISNVQIWMGQTEVTSTPTTGQVVTSTPVPEVTNTPGVSAECSDVKVYDTTWNPLSSNELADLETGDIVRFTVSGTSSSGNFDKARFTINGVLQSEVAAIKPGSNEYYDEYTIPAGVTAFTVTAQIHHTELGWF
jgi:hypothetical protein